MGCMLRKYSWIYIYIYLYMEYCMYWSVLLNIIWTQATLTNMFLLHERIKESNTTKCWKRVDSAVYLETLMFIYDIEIISVYYCDAGKFNLCYFSPRIYIIWAYYFNAMRYADILAKIRNMIQKVMQLTVFNQFYYKGPLLFTWFHWDQSMDN